MKKLAGILCLSALTTGAFAQGLINYQNSGQTLLSTQVQGQSAQVMGNTPGQYFFGLLISPSGAAGSFNFTGLYATNTAATTGGRLAGGNGISVPGWGAGVTMSYEIAGWDSSLGHTFNAAWLTTHPAGFFGVSPIASGAAGGVDATGNSIPTYNLFGGATGIPTGFTLTSSVPEPSSMALAGLGAAALLIFRRRK
ncbi:MAG TPA: PEP-CTERM sorting domain-containing protein [Verrucomicrobiae bacterium]|nr:PEP-CTERM sorting domain-containing protein [Verrucomicrobiae bacterium]